MACCVSAQSGFDPNDILVAVGQKVLDEEPIAARLAFPPERFPRPAPEMRYSGFDGQSQGFSVHICEHQDTAADRIGDDGRDETVGIEARRERRALFKLRFV